VAITPATTMRKGRPPVDPSLSNRLRLWVSLPASQQMAPSRSISTYFISPSSRAAEEIRSCSCGASLNASSANRTVCSAASAWPSS
jgi:hypothetical protein